MSRQEVFVPLTLSLSPKGEERARGKPFLLKTNMLFKTYGV
jgi:hypothetical protein